MSNQEVPFQLIAWIKRQQEDKPNHQQLVATRRHTEDKTFLEYVTVIAQKCWNKLSRYERTMMMNLVERHRSHFNLTDTQRSAIIGIYMKHGGKW
jgi:hypothetical protein